MTKKNYIHTNIILRSALSFCYNFNINFNSYFNEDLKKGTFNT